MPLEEIAKQLGTSKTNLTRALRIGRNLTDTMKELLDAGEITKTFASDIKQPIQIQNSSKKEKGPVCDYYFANAQSYAIGS